MSDTRTRRAALYLGLILTVVLILNQGLSFIVTASQTFKASMVDEPRGEELRVRLGTSTGRPTILERLFKQAKDWVSAYYVGGVERTNAETGITVSISGTNVAATAYVDYYIEAKDSGGGGAPYRFLEGNGTAVAVGGAALDLSNKTTIENHLAAMGLSTEASHTVDYYVHVRADVTGAVSGETLTTEIPLTKFDTVTYEYGTEVTDNYQVDWYGDDGYVLESGDTYNPTSTAQNAGDYSSDIYDWGCWQRFKSIQLTQGKTIESSYLKWSFRYRDDSPTVVIRGNDVDDANNPSSLSAFLAKTRTGNSTSWTPGSHSNFEWFSSPDTSAVVQEILDRPGWSSGNDLMLFVEDDTEGWGGTKQRIGGYTYDHNPTVAPKLDITYMSYSASWYSIPPLSVVDLPVTMDLVAIASVVATAVIVARTLRERRKRK